MYVVHTGSKLSAKRSIYFALVSLRKTVEKVSPILVTVTSRSVSDFERSNVSLKENKPDGVNPNSNDIDHYVRKNERKILWFSADCVNTFSSQD